MRQEKTSKKIFLFFAQEFFTMKRQVKASLKVRENASASVVVAESPEKGKKKERKAFFTVQSLWREEDYETLRTLVIVLKKVIKDKNFSERNMNDAMERHFAGKFSEGFEFCNFKCVWGKGKPRAWSKLFKTMIKDFQR